MQITGDDIWNAQGQVVARRSGRHGRCEPGPIDAHRAGPFRGAPRAASLKCFCDSDDFLAVASTIRRRQRANRMQPKCPASPRGRTTFAR
jgi:hypothetical protein